MSDPEPRDEREDGDEDDAPASTPFDNPFFLPALLWVFAAWFGYDIVTNAPAYQEHPKFNQYGLIGTSVLAVYFTWSAIRERRARREDSPD